MHVRVNILICLSFSITKVNSVILIIKVKVSKAIPVTGCGGPQGCETSRFPHFADNLLTDGGEVVKLTLLPYFTPTERILVLISVRG
jgi:hypothetical protein